MDAIRGSRSRPAGGIYADGRRATLNDALLSVAIQVAADGTAPMLLLWDRTDGRVVAFAGLNQATNDILCNRPGVHPIADLTEADRIALPAIKSSMQAIILMTLSERRSARARRTVWTTGR